MAVHNAKWRENAIPLSIIHHKRSKIVSNLVNYIYNDIKHSFPKNHKTDKFKSAIRLYLLNVWAGYIFDMPIRFSRNIQAFTCGTRYKALFFSYSIMISVVDALATSGYLNQVMGKQSKDNIRRQTRIWTTDKLKSLFKTFGWKTGDIHPLKIPPPEIIQLKNKNKILTKYNETRRTTRMRNSLIKINKFNETLNCTVKLDRYTLVNKRFLFQKLVNGIFKTGIFELTKVLANVDGLMFGKSFDAYLLNEYKTLMALDLKPREVELNQKFYLGDIGIDILEFKLAYNTWHRVFNESFRRTGRIYGGAHLELLKEIRKNNLYFGGIPTVSLDYQAMHCRMCYHIEGIDYQGDIYNIGLERKHIKLAMLIIFNAKNEEQGMRAILNEFKTRGFNQQYLNYYYIKHLIDTFKSIHSPIKKYFFSGVGNDLQHKDAHLMNKILKQIIIKHKKPCYPVHDEIIVSKNDKQLAEQIMINEYYKLFNFTPIIT